MRWLLALLLVSVAWAGCLGDDAEPSDDGANGDAAPSPTPPPPSSPPPASPQPPRQAADPLAPFALDATGCIELLVFTSVPVENARTFVPDAYTIVGEGAGSATAFVGLKMCDDVLLDGASVGPGSTSDVGVLIEAPDGSEGFHYYQAWWTTDNPALAVRLARQGWAIGLTPENALVDDRVNGLVGTMSFTVPWQVGGDYAAESTGPGAPLPMETHALGWNESPFGTFVVDKVLAATDQGSGAGMLTASEGSLLAQLLGASEANGPSLSARYDMAGEVRPANSAAALHR